MKLDVTITKTSIGTSDYIQIISEDQITVNIVMIAEEIRVKDHREPRVKIPDEPDPKLIDIQGDDGDED